MQRAAGGSGRLYVLAIGVGDYQRPEYRLELPAKDARDFVGLMQRQAGRHYREVEARLLLDREATRQAVLDGLRWLTDNVTRDDIGMLFIAGHGINSPNHRYYFLPFDGRHEDLQRTGVSEAAIRNTLSRLRGKALFFVDTCFGGNAVGNFATASRELARLANDLPPRRTASSSSRPVQAGSSPKRTWPGAMERSRWRFSMASMAGPT